ncbi:MAG: DUF4125 family protein [Lachnospiraceae bacterium]|nr:DUF4125 family protein [Lachnospiraceae bacterium]
MNIEEIFNEIDRLYSAGEGEKVEGYILSKLGEAAEQGDENVMVQLLNELIGHYRETGDFDSLKLFAGKLLGLLEGSSLKGSMAHATSLLNVANAYRAAGMLDESTKLYQDVKAYYDANIEQDSMLYASLLNNMSLLFQEKGDFESAADCLERALGISQKYSECRIEQATTHTNLAETLIKLGNLDEAEDHLARAFSIFEEDEKPDYHYSAALAAMGELCFLKKEYERSAGYYEKSLVEIERCVGRSHAYEITKKNMEAALEMARSEKGSISGLELARLYYEQYGKKMIHDKFPEYEDRIAAGLVGEGSECFGFDDGISRDHDFGPGFIMWLAKEDYKKIGKALQKEYDRLPKEFMGYRRIETANAGKRTGVFTVGKFYKKLLGIKNAPKTDEQWLGIDESCFAHAANGEVFADPLGAFTWIRNRIKDYYPDGVWRRRIAQSAALASQSGQYNFQRMLGRGDVVAASLYLSDFIRNAMQLLYLLNRQYAPYTKWMHKGLYRLENTGSIPKKLERLADIGAQSADAASVIEDICTEILQMMNNMGLTSDQDNYLEHHAMEIISGHVEKGGDISTEALADRITALEWKAFDKVENQGGRASCQDDWDTFSVMRKSQYLLWNREMLLQYLADFEAADARGWNLITEKYGRMEETTAPEEYEKIKDALPPISDEKKQIIEAIVAIQVGMMEEFAKEYPKSAGQARNIHTSDDSPYSTSYETYLRGEISTYSDEMLALYGRFVAAMAKGGRNIAKETISNSASLYGYASLEDMEGKL